MSFELGLRRAQTSDVHSVRRLLRGCSVPEDGIEDLFVEAFLVAEGQGELTGVAAVEEHGGYGLLRSVALVEVCRSRPVHALLVAECLDRARQRGSTEAYPLTLDTEGYFESFGFPVLDRGQVPFEIADSSEFDSVCPETAPAMVLDLSGRQAGVKARRQKGRQTWD